MNNTSATRVKNFDFDNGASGNIFSRPYISLIANGRLQGGELCNGKSYIKKLYTRL